MKILIWKNKKMEVHYAGFTDKVSKEDVESGGYEGYPIIKYKEK